MFDIAQQVSASGCSQAALASTSQPRTRRHAAVSFPALPYVQAQRSAFRFFNFVPVFWNEVRSKRFGASASP